MNQRWIISALFFAILYCFIIIPAAAAIQVDWTQATDNAGFPTRSGQASLIFDNKMWVIGGTGSGNLNDVWYSSDGTSWTSATSAAQFSGRYFHSALVYDNKMWVIGGFSGTPKNDVWYSSDGITWTQATSAAGFSGRAGHTSLVYDNKMWVIGGHSNSVGTYNDVWYSSDGITWTQATSAAAFPKRYSHSSVVFDGKMWVIGGCENSGSPNYNDVWYSTDGITWTPAGSSIPFQPRYNHASVVYDNKIWVIGGTSPATGSKNDVWYSEDGITWSPATTTKVFGSRYGHSSLVFDNKIWTIAGYSGGYRNDVWFTDGGSGQSTGLSWTKETDQALFSKRVGSIPMVSNEKLFLVGGSDPTSSFNDIWESGDGVTWSKVQTTQPFPARQTPGGVVFNNKMWIVGGYQNGWLGDIWSSADGGVTWTQAAAPTGARNVPGVLVHNNRMWVIGGSTSGGNLLNDVWSTADGTSWAQVTSSAGFSPRTSMSVATFNGRMWLTGGRDISSRHLADVWSSDDGVTWTREVAAATFPGRMAHKMVVYDNRLWIIGGYDGTKYLNDVWYTSDGKTWYQDISSPVFSPRAHLTATTFKDNIWVIGGGIEGAQYNDVWHTGTAVVTPTPTPTQDPMPTLLVDDINVKNVVGDQRWSTKFGKEYAIILNVQNPTGVPTSRTISAKETRHEKYLHNDTQLIPETPNTYNFSDQQKNQEFHFHYLHTGDPFYGLRATWDTNFPFQPQVAVYEWFHDKLEWIEPGLSWMISTFSKDAPGRKLGALMDLMDLKDLGAGIWRGYNHAVGCTPQVGYSYKFTSENVNAFLPLSGGPEVGGGIFDGPLNSYPGYSIIVKAEDYKIAGWYNALFNELIYLVENGISYKLGNLLENAVDGEILIGHAKIPSWQVIVLMTELNMATQIHEKIMEQSILQALDPVPDYTAPIQVDTIHFSELDALPNNAGKQYVLQLETVYAHNSALTDATIKYTSAVEANDTVWSTRLLKERYVYQSRVVDDYDELEVHATNFMAEIAEIMDKSPLTDSDIDAMKANLSQSGLPANQTTFYKKYGMNDNNLNATSQLVQILPNKYYANYSTVIISAIRFNKVSNAVVVQSLAEELGDSAPPFADFSASPTSGKAPLTVQFTDASLRGPDQWIWNFGDGATATTQNTEHTYTTAGTYTVNLTVTNSTTGSDTRTRYALVTVIAPTPPIPNFTATPRSGKVPLTVMFNDTSIGGEPTLWYWTFGDGSDAAGPDVTHTYTAPGNYTVVLEVANGDGDVFETRPDYIMVTPLTPPVVDFRADVTSGKAPLVVRFADNSTNAPTAWQWSFGDGYVSTEQNPVHQYDVSGNYTVSLNATNADGGASLSKPEYIHVARADTPTELIDQLITYIRNQNNVPKFYQHFLIGELKDAKRSLQQNRPGDAVLQMKWFRMTVSLFDGWPLTHAQARTMKDSADGIIKSINLPVNQPAIEQTKALSAEVKSLNLQRPVENTLVLKLDGTVFMLECGKDRTANVYLDSFIASVRAQDGKKIPHDKAVQLIAKAQAIKAIL